MSAVDEKSKKIPAAVQAAATVVANYFGPSAEVAEKSEVPDKKTPAGAVKLAAVGSVPRFRGGLNQITVVLPVSSDYTNSAANVTDGVGALDVTYSTEWSSFLALYDEYRIHKFRYEFQRFAGSTNATSLSDGMTVFAYDTASNSPLTSVRNGCEASKHQLYATSVSGADVVTMSGGKPLFFEVVLPKPGKGTINVNSSGAVVTYPGAWKTMQANGSNADPDGYLKVYWRNGNASTTAAVIGGIVFYTVQFRRRR